MGEIVAAAVIVIRRLMIVRNFIIIQYWPSITVSRVWMEYDSAFLVRGGRIGVVQLEAAGPSLELLIGLFALRKRGVV